MRVMTIATIVLHRLVLEQERTAFLGMAVVAGLVDGSLDQHVITLGTVGIVAIGAHHLAFAHRVARKLVQVGFLISVTTHASVHLRLAVEDLVFAFVHLVTIIAGNILSLIHI